MQHSSIRGLKQALMVTMVIGLCVSHQVQAELRAPAGAEQNSILEVLKLLPAGTHQGRTPEGHLCTVTVSQNQQMLNVSAVDDQFDLDRDSGSSCMYRRACFTMSPASKILDSEIGKGLIELHVKNPGAAVDVGLARKMSLEIGLRPQGTKVVKISESSGSIIHLFKVYQSTCLL